MADLEAEFQQAAEDVKKLPEAPDNSDLLELYALFKQSTKGDCDGARPGMFNMVARAKYDAWAEKKGTSKDDAMKAYIAFVKKLQG